MTTRRSLPILIALVTLIATMSLAADNARVFDPVSYSEKAARALWQPMTGSPPVSLVNVAGRNAVEFTCRFAGNDIDRASWDRIGKIDMTTADGVQFLFRSRDVAPISGFTVYFRAGRGWYRTTFDGPVSDSWTTIKLHKRAAGTEESPSSWGDVDAIRISAWKGRETDTSFQIAQLALFGGSGKVVVVKAASAAGKSATAARDVTRFTDIVTGFLDDTGIDYLVLDDLDLSARRLANRKLLVLPYNPQVPPAAQDEIKTFIKGGGKMLCLFHLPPAMESVTGIKSADFIRQSRPGYFASIRPSETPLRDMPDATKQNSWNITEAVPVDNRARTVALWYSDDGKSTDKPAIVASDTTVFFSHVLLAGDEENKVSLLLSMLGQVCPELWSEAAASSLAQIGRFGPYTDFDAAIADMKQRAGNREPALAVINKASRLHYQARAEIAAARYTPAIFTARSARAEMINAYCLVQKAVPDEHRAFWCHSAFGVDGISWDHAARILSENGFTAVLPNMLWGGVAYYDSEVLPLHKSVAERGDQIRLCLAACRKYGLKCHVWKVNFNMGWAADAGFMKAMKDAGRTQVNFSGQSNDRWLCPSNPLNQALEIDAMLEVAGKYPVDGLHFDYIRYPGSDNCFCSGCRQRFESETGRKIKNWPADIRASADMQRAWNDFRRSRITKVVEEVSRRARVLRPGIQISAAVFRDWPIHRDTVAQDWKLWCDRGYLDFVCPMDYTAQSSHFDRMVADQQKWAGDVPVYPGIGLSVWSDRTDVCKLIEQINITRKHNTGGFTVFNYAKDEAYQVLPMLGKGITKPR